MSEPSVLTLRTRVLVLLALVLLVVGALASYTWPGLQQTQRQERLQAEGDTMALASLDAMLARTQAAQDDPAAAQTLMGDIQSVVTPLAGLLPTEEQGELARALRALQRHHEAVLRGPVATVTADGWATAAVDRRVELADAGERLALLREIAQTRRDNALAAADTAAQSQRLVVGAGLLSVGGLVLLAATVLLGLLRRQSERRRWGSGPSVFSDAIC